MYDHSVKSGKFTERNKLPKTIEIWDKNILIAGFGRIGKKLISRCLAFETNVYVYDPYVDEKIIEKFGPTNFTGLVWKSENEISISKDKAESLFKLLNILEENEDVQAVSSNFDVSDDVLESLAV